jgi:type I restriction enzyme M protein
MLNGSINTLTNQGALASKVTAPRRAPSDRADLAVYEDDKRKDVFIVIECKEDGETDSEFLQAIDRLVR